MFSVGATPYNSAARMRYGGWATTPGLDIANPISGDPSRDYQNYVALKMAARYDPQKTGQERANYRTAASMIYNFYRGVGRYDPNHPAYVAWKNVVKSWKPPKLRQGLSRLQRGQLWDRFFNLPFDANPSIQDRSTLMALRQAPYRALPEADDLGAVLAAEADVANHYYIPERIERARGYIRDVPQGFDPVRWRNALGSAWGGAPAPIAAPAFGPNEQARVIRELAQNPATADVARRLQMNLAAV